MKTQISKENPFSFDRYGFVWEMVHKNDNLLDYGCHDGLVLSKLRFDGNALRVGVDLSDDAIIKGKQKFPQLKLETINKTEPLNYIQQFDKVLLMDVLEHVNDQQYLLQKLHSVLKQNGKLILTVPKKHFFSWLDLGNYKFWFPRLHKWYYCMKKGKDAYEYRYGGKNPFGLCGDIEIGKNIHEHFSEKKISNLLEKSGFKVVQFDGTGFWQRLLVLGGVCLPFLKKLVVKLNRIDSRKYESCNLFCVAEKIKN